MPKEDSGSKQTRLEEPVMVQQGRTTPGGKQASGSFGRPASSPMTRDAGVPEAPDASQPQAVVEEVPEAPSVVYPNINQPGQAQTYAQPRGPNTLNYPPGTPVPPGPGYPNMTMTTNLNQGPQNQTAPPVNPAPGHPQVMYSAEQVEAMFRQRLAQEAALTPVTGGGATPVPAAVVESQRMITVHPTKTVKPYIGDRFWHLEKDVKVRVPVSVAEVLFQSGCIYPVFNAS